MIREYSEALTYSDNRIGMDEVIFQKKIKVYELLNMKKCKQKTKIMSGQNTLILTQIF